MLFRKEGTSTCAYISTRYSVNTKRLFPLRELLPRASNISSAIWEDDARNKLDFNGKMK